MNKKLFILLTAVLILAACNPVTTQPSEEVTDEAEAVTEEVTETVSEDDSFFGSIEDLLAKGKSQKCTYKMDDQTGSAEGVVYMDGKNMLSKMTIVEEGQTIETHTLVLDDWSYVWTNMSDQGFKMNVEGVEEKMPDNSDSEVLQDMRNEMNYKCENWRVDKSKFQVPSDVSFMDQTAMMEGFVDAFEGMDLDEAIPEMEAAADQASAQLCAMCASAPTPELKAECMADAGCA